MAPERRFGTGLRQEATPQPGLILDDAGLVYLIHPDLTRCLLDCGGGGGNTPLPSGVGDMLYSADGATWTVLPIDADGEVLTVVGGVPAWEPGGTSVIAGDALAFTGDVLDVLVDGVTIDVNGSNQLRALGAPPTGAAGGDLAGTYPNPTLAVIGAAAGPIGDGTHVPVVTIDAKGRVTGLTSQVITGAPPSGAAGGVLSGTYPNPGFAVDMATQAELDAAVALLVALAPATTARNVVQPTDAAVVPFTLKGFTAQSANLLDFRDSADVLMTAFDSAGRLRFGTTGDTNLYRSGADALATDDEFDVLGVGRNRIDTLTITGSPTGGSFTIQVGTVVTPALAFNSTAAQVQNALRALPIFALGGDLADLSAITSVQCAGGPLPGTPITIELLAPYAALVSNIAYTLVNSLTGGAAPTVATAITTTALPAAATDRVIVTAKGINLPPGGSIRGMNQAGTTYIPLISRPQTTNSVVIWTGAGTPGITLTTSNQIGLGVGNVSPGLAGSLAYGGGETTVGGISIFNRGTAGAGGGITAVTVKAGLNQATNYWMRFINYAGALVWRILPDGTMQWGSASDVNLYRGGADQLRTDDSLVVALDMMTLGKTKIAAQADLTINGITLDMTAGETLAFGDPVYIKSDGKVWKADANGTATFPAIGIAGGTAAANATVSVLVRGMARSDAAWNWTVGGLIYLSTSAGLTQTQPSSTNDVIQVLGVAATADVMYVAPELFYVTHV